MLKLLSISKVICDGCGKAKMAGAFSISAYYEPRYDIYYFCPTCLENAAREIANKTDKVYYDRDTNKWMNLYREDIQELEKLYPNCNVIHELEVEMPRWLKTTKGLKKSRKADWNRFINNWLKKEQIKVVGL